MVLGILQPHDSWWDDKLRKARGAHEDSAPLLAFSKSYQSKPYVVFVLSCSVFLADFSTHSIEPFLAAIQDSLKIPDWKLVSLEAGFAFGFLALCAFLPLLISTIGSKRLSLGACIIVFSTALLFVLFPSFWLLFSCRIFQGLTSCILIVTSYDLSVKLFLGREAGFKQSTGILGAAESVGRISSVLCCLLVDRKDWNLNGVVVPFTIVLVASVFTILMRMSLSTPFDVPYAPEFLNPIEEMQVVSKKRYMVPVLTSILILRFVVTSWAATLPLWLSDSLEGSLRIQASFIALLFACMCIGDLLGGFVLEKGWIRDPTLWILSYTLCIPAVFLFMVNMEICVELGLIVGGISLGFFSTATKCILPLIVEPRLYTSVYSVCFFVQAIARLCATLGGTIIVTSTSFLVLQIFSAILLLVFLPWTSVISRELNVLLETNTGAAEVDRAQKHIED